MAIGGTAASWPGSSRLLSETTLVSSAMIPAMETTIRLLFSDQDRRFKIPAYQRAYSWDKEQILQFVEDLKDAGKGYYLGHFLFEQDATNLAANTLLIIDGQQRLTTCIIFFSALHRTLEERKKAGETVAVDTDDIVHNYLRDTRKGIQKLSTVSDDNNFFETEIIDLQSAQHLHPTTASQNRIREARALFEQAFKPQTTTELERWYHLILNADCTEYRVKGKEAAARIFAFQNDRGKRLSNLEVLKAYFMLQIYLHSASPEAMEAHLAYLEIEVSAIYRQIVRVNAREDDVLLYCWRACPASKGFDSENTVKEIKEYVTAGAKGEICERIKRFMADLAEAFRVVEQIEKSPVEAIRHLLYLNNMALAYPFFICARVRGASDGQIEKLARLLENVIFRVILIGGRARIEARLNHYLKLAPEGDYVDALAAGMVSDLRHQGWWSYWSDKAVQDALDDANFYGSRITNYILWRYELYLCSRTGYQAPLKVGYADLISRENIEHIAPQTPSDGGPVANGYGPYEDAGDPENGIVSGHWMNCLGNLMLIAGGHNIVIRNHDFGLKLDSYGKGNLLNQQKEIIDFVFDKTKPVWDQEAIERRLRVIQQAAAGLWALDKIS